MAETGSVVGNEKRLEILHDHYKETFARVVQVERARDRQFFWVILLFALLIVGIGYPAAFQQSMGGMSVLGLEVRLSSLPLAALLNATWVLTLAVTLSYCRTCIWVTRQYRYVHELEARISGMLKAGDVYLRESKYYEDSYPTLLNMAWVSYVFIFPAIMLFAVIGLIYWEVTRLAYSMVNRLLDGTLAISIILVFFFYQVQPYVSQKWKDWKSRQVVSVQPFNE